MSQQQTLNAPTNADYQTPVSFADVSLTTLKLSFNDTYKVSKGSASQVVLGFQSMSERLQEPTNEYQQTLYPKLKELCTRLSTKYDETFLTTFADDVERQVFGANLNGNRNNGSLYRSIPSGVNRNLTYNYAQFGQLMRVLTSRLRFIAQRDPTSVQRYKDSAEETSAYQTLQSRVNTFLTFIGELLAEWNTLVSETRTKFVPSQSESQTPHQPRDQRQPRDQHQPRQPRSFNTRQSTDLPAQSANTTRPQYRPVRRQESSRNSDNGEWVTPRVTVHSRNGSSAPKSSVTV